MNKQLALIPIRDQCDSLKGAFHEAGACEYLDINRTYFSRLVKQGIIPYTFHLIGNRRIYLRTDLDAYLESLPKRTMAPRENSPKPMPLKGARTK